MTAGSRERTLGPGELPVTAIGLGLAALGSPGYLNLGHGDDLGSDRSVAASLDAVALAAALAGPWADVVLSGAASREQITSNLAARQVAWDGEAAAALGRLAEEPESYWRTRGELVWN